MKRYFLIIGLLICVYISSSQNVDSEKWRIFWKEDFSTGKFPDDWTIRILNDSSISWICTDQPFPGSFGYDQQAPPIASSSRGFHAQFAPGIKVDKFYRKWEKAGIYPDAYFQTGAIDCSGKSSVVLKFRQNFKWNNWSKVRQDGGLFVGVSNNLSDWKEYEVRNGIGSEADCPNPMPVELNITSIAANQKTVYLRYFWRGIHAWYWMVDDIELSEALDVDISAVDLISHPETGNSFSANDTLVFQVVNLGAVPVTTSFICFLEIDQRKPVQVQLPFTASKPFGIIDTVLASFPGQDLSDIGIHSIKFYTSLPGDNRTANDTLNLSLYSRAYQLGEVTSYSRLPDSFTFECNRAVARISFQKEDIFRIEMSYDGHFIDPAGKYLVINPPASKTDVGFSDIGDYYLLRTSQVALRVYKHPLRFEAFRADNRTQIWSEVQDLTYGKVTAQYLKRGESEDFYGAGMQNGRFSHRDQVVRIDIDWNWEEGGNPNPAPFYMSTNGYAALRNTFSPGVYAFGDTIITQHSEARFDCYYMVGNSLKDLLDDYTSLTGRPFLPPRWALSLGDANCYNRGAGKSRNTTGYKGTTPDVIPLIADQYLKHNMPRGWILPNDGYGCGYTALDSVIGELGKRGFRTGLWTENGVEKIAREVGEYGSRLCKLDVAWIGNGYQFAMDGCKAAYDGIENNSDARGFVWSVCGWAGTHRNSVVWTGDQSGSWDYIRWHIPTLIGSGLSGLNCATGDVDGIFAGSAETYTRDLQWKCFTPVFMAMSGWAPKDKQPYVYGEPYTSINRKYLMLKQRLTPYMYTLCREASETGVPAVRGLVLEYPDDLTCRGDLVNHEFLLGKSLLVAPVYRDAVFRDSIYLPEGEWFDFWDGRRYPGNNRINHYPAPLEKLPLFVKAGSIIPMYPQMYYDGERAADTITLDIYPGKDTEFEMYEDDGFSREYRDGRYSKTRFSAVFEDSGKLTAELRIDPVVGEYKGMLSGRCYQIVLHQDLLPSRVLINGKPVRYFRNQKGPVRKKHAGYYSDSLHQQVIVTGYIHNSEQLIIHLQY